MTVDLELDAGDEEDAEILDSAAKGDGLGWREKAMRRKFAAEYLIDYNAKAAAVRCGYHASFAKEYANKFMEEPYVQNLIQAMELGNDTGGVQQTPEEAKEALKKRILASLIREAHYTGPGSTQAARVAALSKLAQMQGMDAPAKSSIEVLGRDGKPLADGVFIIPNTMSPEEWEEAARLQQEALQQNNEVAAPEVTKH